MVAMCGDVSTDLTYPRSCISRTYSLVSGKRALESAGAEAPPIARIFRIGGSILLAKYTAGEKSLLGGWFIRRQRRLDNPLLDLGLFSIRGIRTGAIVLLTSTLAFMSVDFVLMQ